MLNPTLPTLIIAAITLLVAFPVHEFAHAWMADRLGDDTPRLDGRLTLNPLVHLDVMGSLLFLVAFIGWAKPVRFNPAAVLRRTPAGVMLVAAAGPVSNLIMAFAASLPFQFGLLGPAEASGALTSTLSGILGLFIWLNLILFFFNLIPIFPLDGEKILHYFLSPSGRLTMERIRPYGSMILIALILLGQIGNFNILGVLVRAPTDFIFELLV